MASWVNFILFVSWKAEALYGCSRRHYCCQFITGDVSLEEDNNINIMSFELKNQMERWTELLMVVAPLLYLLFSIVSLRLIFVLRTFKGQSFFTTRKRSWVLHAFELSGPATSLHSSHSHRSSPSPTSSAKQWTPSERARKMSSDDVSLWCRFIQSAFHAICMCFQKSHFPTVGGCSHLATSI